MHIYLDHPSQSTLKLCTKNKLTTIYRSPMMFFNFECRCGWFSDVFLWTPPIWALELDLTSQIIPLFLQHELSTQVVLRKHGPLWTNSGMATFLWKGCTRVIYWNINVYTVIIYHNLILYFSSNHINPELFLMACLYNLKLTWLEVT